MPAVRNGRVLFNSIPEGYPVPGETTIYDDTKTIDPDTVPLDGGFLIKLLEFSVEPFLRASMRDAKDTQYEAPAYILGHPIWAFGIGLVVRSDKADVKPGDHIYGVLSAQEYTVTKDMSYIKVLENPHNLPWSAFIGVLGMPGHTAYMGWNEFSKAKKGETLFVSAGSGPVGSLIIQLAKADGLKVIASAGSQDKVEFMKSIGADVAFNYKTTSGSEVLKKEGPIDIYWDNVGGETLDTALEAARKGARFIECGMISGYGAGGSPVKNLFHVIRASITIHGLLVTELMPKWTAQFEKEMPEKVASGRIKYREDVYNGLETVGDVILAVLKGTNKAKVVVHVADG